MNVGNNIILAQQQTGDLSRMFPHLRPTLTGDRPKQPNGPKRDGRVFRFWPLLGNSKVRRRCCIE